MRIAVVCLVAVACLGVACSNPPPQAPKKPPSQTIVRTPVSSVPTCADMGPLLRGSITGDEDLQGPKKEAAIVATCERDRWPSAVITCVASSTEPTVQSCLDQLDATRRVAYDKAVEGFGGHGFDEEDDPPPDNEVTCEIAFASTSVDRWPPEVIADGERPLATKLRFNALSSSCRANAWDEMTLRCIESTPAKTVDTCFGDTRRAEVTRLVTDADALRTKIVKVLGKPSNTCENAAAFRYRADMWKGKAPELKGAARTNAITAAKASMRSACKGWSLETRACIVAAPNTDACFALESMNGWMWGYPPKRYSETGIEACDDYALAVEAMKACSAVPETTKQVLVEAYDQVANAWKDIPPSETELLDATRMACRAAADAIRQVAAACT